MYVVMISKNIVSVYSSRLVYTSHIISFDLDSTRASLRRLFGDSRTESS